MPYDPKNDPNAGLSSSMSFGRKGSVIVPNDASDLPTYAKAIVVLSPGDVAIIPVENADGATLTFTGLAAGQIVPFQVRRVLATGTTASVASILG